MADTQLDEVEEEYSRDLVINSSYFVTGSHGWVHGVADQPGGTAKPQRTCCIGGSTATGPCNSRCAPSRRYVAHGAGCKLQDDADVPLDECLHHCCWQSRAGQTWRGASGTLRLPEQQAKRCGAACPLQPAEPRLAAPATIAEKHDLRRKVTGVVCHPVHYKTVQRALEDMPELEPTDGRIFVRELDQSGFAYKAGVRVGDELVRIQIGSAAPQQPRSPMHAKSALQREAKGAEKKNEPVVIFFMGFVGKFPAEVRVTTMEEYHISRLSMKDLAGSSVFQLHDYMTFSQAGAPLLIACNSKLRPKEGTFSELDIKQQGLSEHPELPPLPVRQHRWHPAGCLSYKMRETAGEATAKAGQEQSWESTTGTIASGRPEAATCEEEEGGPDVSPSAGNVWHILELERKDARSILLEAIVDMPKADAAFYCEDLHVAEGAPTAWPPPGLGVVWQKCGSSSALCDFLGE